MLYGGTTLHPPPVPDANNEPDGHFYWVNDGPRLQYDYDMYDGLIDANSFYLTNLLTGDQIQPSSVTGGDDFSTSVTLNLANLPDGYYESDLKSDADGLPIAVEDKSDFFSLAGDLNHDGVVDEYDGGTFWVNKEYSSGPYNYAQGDVNYDGQLDSADRLIIEANYGTYVHAPPTAPNSLTISSAGPDDNTLYLTWTAPTGDSPDGYHIFRSTDGGINYSLYDTVVGGSNTTYEDNNKGSGLPDGAKYYYRVRAYTDALGNSLTTNEEWSVTNLPAPSDVTITPLGDNSVQVSWTDNSDNESGFEVWPDGASGNGWDDGLYSVGGAGSERNIDGHLWAGPGHLLQLRGAGRDRGGDVGAGGGRRCKHLARRHAWLADGDGGGRVGDQAGLAAAEFEH